MIENRTTIASNPKTSESSKFTRDMIWITFAQLFNSIIVGLVTLPVLTKTYSSEVFGIWSQVNVTVILLSPLFSLQLGESVVRFLSGEQEPSRRRQALGSMLSVIVCISFLAFIAAFLASPQLSTLLFGNPEYTVFVRLTFIWIFINVILTFFVAYLRSRHKIRLLSTRQLILSVITMALVIGLARSGYSLEWVILAVIIAQTIFTLFFVVIVIREVGLPLPNTTGLKTFLAFSIPQIPGSILLWIVKSSDRYFITFFLGLSQAGIYSSSSTIAGLTAMFYGPIGFVLYPMITKLWEEQRFSDVKKYLEYSSRLFLTLAIPTAAGIALLSQSLLNVLTTTEYLAGEGLVLLISIGGIFLGIYQINVYVILLVKKTKILPLIILIASIASIGMNVLLIPIVGILGSAISNITAYFLLAAIAAFWARKSVNYTMNYKYLAKVIMATLIMSVFFYFWKMDGIIGLILASIIGIIIFIAGLLILKAFSEQDKKFIKRTLAGTFFVKE